MSAAAVNIRLGLSIGDYQQGFAAASAITGQFTSEFKSQFDGLKRSADAPAGAFGELGRQLSITRRQIQDVLATGGTVSTELSNRYRLLQGSVNAVQDGLKPPTPALTGYALLNQRLTETRTKMQDLLATGRPVPQALSNEYKKLESQVNQVNGAFRTVQATTSNVANSITSYAAGFFTIGAAIGVVKTGLQVTSDFQRLDASLRAVSTSSADFANTQAFLRGQADLLGLSYETLADGYKNLKAATNGTNLEGAETERIFRSVIRAGAALRLSSDDVQGSLRALTQMISTGTVQSDELKNELGNRLPGALKLMANALGVTQKELIKMLEQGQVMANDALPKLATELEKTFGASAQANVNSMAGGFTRATTQLKLFTSEFSQSAGIDSFFTKVGNKLSNYIRGLREAQSRGEGLFLLSGDRRAELSLQASQRDTFRAADPAARKEMLRLAIAERDAYRAGAVDQSINEPRRNAYARALVGIEERVILLRRENVKIAAQEALATKQAAARNTVAPSIDLKSLQKEQSALAESIANAKLNGQATGDLQRRYDALTTRIDAATASTKRQTTQYKEQAGAIEVNNRLIANLRRQLESNTVKGKDASDVKRYNDENKTLANQIALLELDNQERQKRIDLINKPVLAGKDIAQVSIVDKIKAGLDPVSDGLKSILGDLRSFGSTGFLQNEISKIQGLAANSALNFKAPSDEAIAKLRQYTLLLRQADDAVQLQGLQADSLNGFDGPNFDAVAAVVGRLRTMKETINLSVGEITQSMKSQKLEIVGAISGLFSGIGESIGRGQNPLKAGLQYILNILGDYAIKIGTAALISSTALLAAAPFLAGATLPQGIGLKLTGAGLILAGGVVKGLAATAFANGGIVYGPTLGLMGEYSGARNNPEVIAPLDKLQSIMGRRGGTQVYIPELRMSYDAIYVAFKRGEEAHQYLS